MLSKLTIIAPGLLGSSVAMAARQRRLADTIAIWARRPEARDALASQEWCDEAPADIEATCQGSDLIVLCAPVERIIDLAHKIAPSLDSMPIVTDVGSVKSDIVRHCAQALQGRAHFIGSHPMAGSEKTGMDNARQDLFEGRSCFVTPTENSDPAACRKVRSFWTALGCSVIETNPEIHDETVALVSHLPHLVASCLADFIGRSSPNASQACGNGLRDTTRIAAGDAQLWKEIVSQNRHEISRALARFQDHLQGLHAAIANENDFELLKRLSDGKAFRDSLDSKK